MCQLDATWIRHTMSTIKTVNGSFVFDLQIITAVRCKNIYNFVVSVLWRDKIEIRNPESDE